MIHAALRGVWALTVFLCIADPSRVPAWAAVFELKTDPLSRCWVTMQGEILDNDLEGLRHAFTKPQSLTYLEQRALNGPLPDFLCLDSAGGSFHGALKIARHVAKLGLTTMIGDGMSCLSACAIIFMAGTDYYEGQHSKSRYLDVGGRLGFHAPRLIGPDRAPFDREDFERAYVQAIRDVSDFLDLMFRVDFPNTLAAEMMRTPSDPARYFFIDTVDKAGYWRFDILGYTVPALSPQTVSDACKNEILWKFRYSHIYRPGVWGDRGEALAEQVDFQVLGPGRRRGEIRGTPPEYLGKCIFESTVRGRASIQGGHMLADDVFVLNPKELVPVNGWQLRAPDTPLLKLRAPRTYAGVRSSADGTRAVQYQLRRWGVAAGPIDGRWGPMTENALKRFAEELGLEDNAATGDALIRLLFSPVHYGLIDRNWRNAG